MLKPKALDCCWVEIECEKIFVRPNEYKEAEELAISACGDPKMYPAFLVTGQPGMGSSIFPLVIVGVFESFFREIYLSTSSSLATPRT